MYRKNLPREINLGLKQLDPVRLPISPETGHPVPAHILPLQ